MKKVILAITLLAFSLAGLHAQDGKIPQLRWYGFVRNYLVIDSRESVFGTDDFYYYLPKDELIVDGEDLNRQMLVSFGAITSRLGVDITGGGVNGWTFGGRIEADFYSGLSGVTGTAQLRLRQAFITLRKDNLSLKVGQAWHPMATDLPTIFALNGGAPFGPFSRTPEIVADWKLSEVLTLNAAAIWQMQYTSTGPAGHSADYMKYSGVPEFYLGLSARSGGLTARAGIDVLSIRPRHLNETRTKKVDDRLTTFTPFVFLEYTDGLFTARAKSVFAQAGEHMNLNGGYGVSAVNADGSWEYTPTRNSSSWINFSYGKKVQGVMYLGYVRNFGTAEPLVGTLYFSKNSFSNLNRLMRVTPEVMFNWERLTLGLEYELTGAQYGSFGAGDLYGLATENLHWVFNNRIQLMLRYTF